MSNVLPAFWENLHAKPGEPAPSRPFAQLRLKCFPSRTLPSFFFTQPLSIFTNANTLILVSEFSRPFFFFPGCIFCCPNRKGRGSSPAHRCIRISKGHRLCVSIIYVLR